MKKIRFGTIVLMVFITVSVKGQNGMFMPSSVSDIESIYAPDTANCSPKCFVVYWMIPGLSSGHYDPVDSITASRIVNYDNRRYGKRTHWMKNICEPEKKKPVKKETYPDPKRHEAFRIFILFTLEECVWKDNLAYGA